MRKSWVILLSLLLIAAAVEGVVAAVLDAGPPPVALSVRYGIARYSNGQTVTFPRPFSSVPVVVTSAQLNGRAVSSCALNNSTTAFQISLFDENKHPVQSAWVQWIAFVPRASVQVIGGVCKANNGQHITFAAMSGVPIIVTNAQKDGKALNAAAANNAKDGFSLVIRDQDNIPVSDAWIQWMAVIPTSTNRFKGEIVQRNSGANVSFTPAFTASPVYVLSGQGAMEPYAASAVNNRNNGFTLSLIRHDGSAGRNVWTQWIGYAGP
ncbi:MAG: hypothetical protein NTU88_13935 [Armatimonadetes bacterium]|nr:hypothetical protein [Armatimonadota bacterium]